MPNRMGRDKDKIANNKTFRKPYIQMGRASQNNSGREIVQENVRMNITRYMLLKLVRLSVLFQNLSTTLFTSIA